MIIKSFIIWILVFAFMLTSTPEDETAICGYTKSLKHEYDFDGMDVPIHGLKSVVSILLEIDETEVDMELFQDIFTQVGEFYLENIRFVSDTVSGFAMIPIREGQFVLKSAVADLLEIDQSEVDMELVRDIFAQVGEWYLEVIRDAFDQISKCTVFVFQSGKSVLKKAVADLLVADENDIDMELCKEVIVEVAKWYADTLKDAYTNLYIASFNVYGLVKLNVPDLSTFDGIYFTYGAIVVPMIVLRILEFAFVSNE